MHRFFVPPETLRTARVHLTGEVAHQISRVLRLRPGDLVYLLDGRGFEYRMRIADLGKEQVWGEVAEKRFVPTEPAHSVDLYLSLLNKTEKFEWALQKCTEVGAARFIPVVAQRSVTASGRPERWERIIQEAAEQSGRGLVPSLDEVVPLNDALEAEGDRVADAEGGSHIAIMPALGADLSLSDALEELTGEEGSVSIFIGPEGGFTEDELYAANELGILLVNLGPRILRAETAAVSAVTMTLQQLGDMG
jgi:16S rRNA (uracil1498-N3)-methyltransferase